MALRTGKEMQWKIHSFATRYRNINCRGINARYHIYLNIAHVDNNRKNNEETKKGNVTKAPSITNSQHQ